MIATGKRRRKATGLNRFQLHFTQHAVKSAAKRRRMGWGKASKR